MDNEMRSRFTGPMPVNEFFEDFLSMEISEEAGATWPGFEGVALGAGKEKDMYNEFVSTANSYCPHITAYNASDDPGIESDARYKPDIVFYKANEGPPEGHITSFQRMELFVEFKRGPTSDPFSELGFKGAFPKHFDTSCDIRGQMTLYSTRMQMYQFRTCIFSVGIFGNVARLFRWDRAGAIVSAPIEYSVAGNRELSEFFYRFDRANRTQRGWDPTIHDAGSEETAAFAQAIQTIAGEKDTALLGSLLESVGDPREFPRKKVNITKQKASYIIGRSLVAAESPTGRATRCFVAMDVDTKKLVFLKDSWRPDLLEMKPESHWYKKVKGGSNLAAFLHGSDVEYPMEGGEEGPTQRTITDLHFAKFCEISGMMGYLHHRTVQSEFYLPLKTFKDSQNLTQIMSDVIVAIQDLHEMGVLHRDISATNIMITVGGRGRLIDFDLARDVGYSGARQTVRTGTWQFMSTRLLTVKGKRHELSDDLESLFFVLLFESLHFVKHNKPLGISLKSIFDQVDTEPGNHTGGQGKVSLYSNPAYVNIMNEQLEFTSKPLTILIQGLHRLFASLHNYHCKIAWKQDPDKSDARNVETLGVGVAALLDEAVKSGDWPAECDKVPDQYPPVKRLNPEQKDLVAFSYLNKSTASESLNESTMVGSSSGKRKRGTEAETWRPRGKKRSKVSQP